MRRQGLVAVMLLLSGVTVAQSDFNWPQFRGRHAAVAEGADVPDSWSATRNVAWKTEIPGKGWSSPIVWGDKIFLTAVVSDRKSKPPRKGLYIGNVQGKVLPGVHQWKVLCLDGKTGKILWQKTAHKGAPASAIHQKNTYASETPVTDGKRVYAYFGNLGLFCYDTRGQELWSHKSRSRKTNMGWGTGASPVLHKDRVYIVNDNEEKSFLAAIDTQTGKEAWRVVRQEKSNWATPFLWENDRRTEIVTPGAGKVRSYGLDGKLLWELGGMSSIVIPTPSARHGLLYISSGYILNLKRPVFAIRPGAAGDITLKEGETSNASIAWCQPTIGPYHPSPVVYGDYLYILHDRGFMACYEARTGKMVYKGMRIPGGNAFTASPWAAGGKIFCLNEDGTTFVVQAGREFKVLGTNRLEEMCLATPAVVRNGLIIRTASKLYCIRNEKTDK